MKRGVVPDVARRAVKLAENRDDKILAPWQAKQRAKITSTSVLSARRHWMTNPLVPALLKRLAEATDQEDNEH